MKKTVRRRMRYISAELILPSETPLRGDPDDISSLMALVSSISRYGIINPITVRPITHGCYEIICGSRRFCAAKLAGLDSVPCVIVSNVPPAMALAENMHREKLDFFDEATAFHDLSRHGITPEKTAELLHIPERYVAESLRALTLPRSLLKRIRALKLTARHALAVARLGEDDRGSVLSQVARCGLDGAATEKYVDAILARAEQPRGAVTPVISDARFFLNSVERGVDTMRRSGVEIGYEKSEGDDALTLTLTIPAETKSAAVSE